MNIDFNAEFEAGKTREEILAMIDKQLKEAELKRAAELARQEQEKKEADEKKLLKAEARAYLINAILAYAEAFDLLPEGETFDDEVVHEIEKLILEMEAVMPRYVKMLEAMRELEDETGGEGFNFKFGLY